jgi:hypothetical protein
MTTRQIPQQLIKMGVLLLISAMLISVDGCKRQRTLQEQQVIENLRPFWAKLEDYKRVNMTYPESWDAFLSYYGLQMPGNPYTGQPMIALDSAEFDPDVSPGNIYYMKVVQDEIVVNCQVIIFGDRGEITRYSHAGPFAPK